MISASVPCALMRKFAARQMSMAKITVLFR
jgi:hypothetical protein